MFQTSEFLSGSSGWSLAWCGLLMLLILGDPDGFHHHLSMFVCSIFQDVCLLPTVIVVLCSFLHVYYQLDHQRSVDISATKSCESCVHHQTCFSLWLGVWICQLCCKISSKTHVGSSTLTNIPKWQSPKKYLWSQTFVKHTLEVTNYPFLLGLWRNTYTWEAGDFMWVSLTLSSAYLQTVSGGLFSFKLQYMGWDP